MIETIFGLFVTWQALGVLLFFGIIAEYNEARGMAVFFGILSALSAYFYFNVALADIAVYIVGYVLIGVVWSFYRYKRFIVKKLAQLSESSYRRAEDYHPSKMLDTITAWIIIWPFSLIENLCGDIINAIETLVKRVFKGVYARIYENAVANVVHKNESVK